MFTSPEGGLVKCAKWKNIHLKQKKICRYFKYRQIF